MSDALVIEEGTLSPSDLAMAKEMQAAEVPEEPKVEPEAPEVEEPQEEVSENPFTFKVKGEEKEYTKEQLQNLLAREQTFQQKANKLESSEEYRLGVLHAAAKAGDKGAQKKLRAELLEMVGDGDIDSLEEVEEEYDTEKDLTKRQTDAAFEEAFSDVKSDVDYEETLAKIDEQLKARMPEKVFQKYYDTPVERRTMYDLVKSGRAEEILGALDVELQNLSLTERVRIKNDPDMYGSLVYEVVKDVNARGQQTDTKDQVNPDLAAVSSGNRSHRIEKEEPAPDFATMSTEEFRAYEKKMLGRNI
jgi:hypothetical protein